jgi:threonine synthase
VSAPRALKALEEMDGVAEQATENELCDAAARADRTGMYTCPHTAVALAALEKLVKRGVVKKSDRVIVVSTANGLKFTEFKVRYHDRSIPSVAPLYANAPVVVPPDYDRVLEALDRHARDSAAAPTLSG